ncbi:hypothetical protein WCLP8_10020 [uncultured Gammaproteobacteria bacterium]
MRNPLLWDLITVVQRRFGVAPRLIIGLFALTLLTVLAVAVALAGFTRFRTGFDRIAVSQFNELVLVAKLSQMAQAISVTAPVLVVSNERFELDRAIHHIGDLFKQIDIMIDSLSKSGVPASTMARLGEFRQQLFDTLGRLNRLVSDRIATERRLREALRRVETLERDIRRVKLDAMKAWSVGKREAAQTAPGEMAGDRLAAVMTWTLAIDDAMTSLLLATITARPGDLKRLRTGFENGLQLGQQALSPPPAVFGERAAALTTELAGLASGDQGIFATRSAILEILQEIQGSLNHSKIISTQLIATAANLFVEMKSNIELDRTSFTSALDRDEVLLIVVCGAGAIAAIMIFVFLRYRVISRLLTLRSCMLAYASGERPHIPSGGHDELTDMSDALRFFIAEIDQRESDLRMARDRAENALRELKATQAQLIQAEKMSALSGLVSGVAHEMNTPLGNILTAVSLLADETQAVRRQFDQNTMRRSEMARFLVVSDQTSRIIQSATHRAASLIQTFKQIAVSSTGESRRTIALGAHLNAIITTIRSSLRPYEIAVECPSNIEVISDPGALVQVVTQLLLNAVAHAFRNRSSGEIVISVAPADDDAVRISVRDNGGGIAPENLDRVFEPFFTTTRNEGGTGLGLHIVYNTVTQQLGGQITVTSIPGEGSAFVIVIPSGREETKQ